MSTIENGRNGSLPEEGLYGDHLLLGGDGCDSEKLSDIELVESILQVLPDKLQMNKITEPATVQWLDSQTGEGTISGYVMIAESHIAIHTRPTKGTFQVDVFSCKRFDHGQVERFFQEQFSPQDLQVRSIDRSYPKEPR